MMPTNSSYPDLIGLDPGIHPSATGAAVRGKDVDGRDKPTAVRFTFASGIYLLKPNTAPRPGLTRPSTSCGARTFQEDVGGRAKPGHGVFVSVFRHLSRQIQRTGQPWDKPGHDDNVN